MNWLKVGAVAALCLVSAFLIREVFPKEVVQPAPPPRIRTVYDTVLQLDTAWVDRIREVVRVDTVNLTEVVTITKVDTVEVTPDLDGVTAIEVGQERGDSSLVAGFSLRGEGTLLSRWQYQFWTPGPLQGLVLDSGVPRVQWGEYVPPKRSCGFWCKTNFFLGGAATGVALWVLVGP